MSTLNDILFDEILQARQRVYAVGAPTPLQEIKLPGVNVTVFAKREDLGPIKAYKWRGAYNCMAKLSAEQRPGRSWADFRRRFYADHTVGRSYCPTVSAAGRVHG